MKFRKRKDLIQRKRYKQKEAISILDRYLQNPSNKKATERSSYLWTTQIQSQTPELVESNKETTVSIDVPKGSSLSKVPTESFDYSEDKRPFHTEGTYGATVYNRAFLFKQTLLSKSIAEVNPIVKEKYGAMSDETLKSSDFDSSMHMKLSFELTNQKGYHGIFLDKDSEKAIYGGRSTITKLRNRCIQTNRSRSVSKLMKISRQQVRRLGVKGSLTGCTKST